MLSISMLLLLLLVTACRGDGVGPKEDETFLSFTDSLGLQNEYHRYAAGLDWSKPVGLLVYTDGSGDFGLHNPYRRYLLGGHDGLTHVAKKHNMILVTPFAPGSPCPDGEGACWYLESGGIQPEQKARWSAELISFIQGHYKIDKKRVVFGGFSSGAQWTTQYFGPLFASSIMESGLAVAISYGGMPPFNTTPRFTSEFKANVPFVWNVGSLDEAYTNNSSFGVNAGYLWYTSNGFITSLNVTEGLGHDRRREFGGIIDRAIEEHCSSCFACKDDQPFGTIDEGCDEISPNCDAAAAGEKGLSCYLCRNNNPAGVMDEGCMTDDAPNCNAGNQNTGSECYLCRNNNPAGVMDEGCMTDEAPNCNAGNQNTGSECYFCINDAEDGKIDSGCTWLLPNCNGTTPGILRDNDRGTICSGPALLEPPPTQAPTQAPTQTPVSLPPYYNHVSGRSSAAKSNSFPSVVIVGQQLTLVASANVGLAIVFCTLFF